jgi:hypothetical protein
MEIFSIVISAFYISCEKKNSHQHQHVKKNSLYLRPVLRIKKLVYENNNNREQPRKQRCN